MDVVNHFIQDLPLLLIVQVKIFAYNYLFIYFFGAE